LNPYKNFIHKNVQPNPSVADERPAEQTADKEVTMASISEEDISAAHHTPNHRPGHMPGHPPGRSPMPPPRPPIHPRPPITPPRDHGHRPPPRPRPEPVPLPIPHANPHHTNFNDCPQSPPPTAIPAKPTGNLTRIDGRAISSCMHSNTFVWLKNGKSFWFYPTFVGRNSVSGYRFSRHGWVYLGFDLDRIEAFFCGR